MRHKIIDRCMNGLFLLMVLPLFSACIEKDSTVMSSPTVQNDPGIQTGYPAPSFAGNSAYPVQATRQAYIPSSDLSTENVVMPTPDQGLASVAGILYSYAEGMVIPETVFYLTHAIGENNDSVPMFLSGPKVGEGDYSGWSNADGLFILNNIVPGNYYIVVWAPFNWIIGVQTDNTDTLMLLILRPDSQNNLGVVNFPWP